MDKKELLNMSHKYALKYNPEGSALRRDQKELLRMLQIVAQICREHDIKWWLSSGTLLGAARHKGFIPWDDDIDIGMFRPDYNRLLKLASEMPEECRLFSIEKGDRSARLYGRICNMKYVSVDKYYEANLSNYFGIDIFPLEAVPSDKKEYANFAKKVRLLRRMFILPTTVLPPSMQTAMSTCAAAPGPRTTTIWMLLVFVATPAVS